VDARVHDTLHTGERLANPRRLLLELVEALAEQPDDDGSSTLERYSPNRELRNVVTSASTPG
jgi:hypothetical protein